MTQQAFDEYIKIQNPKVLANTKSVSASQLGQSYMLHIDKDTPNYFTPRIGQSFSDDEDRTLPRVTVSSNLLGCIIGYYRFLKDFLEVEGEKSNGYYINIIPFEYALRPNAKMVPYGEHANEYWLIGYDKDHLKYKPQTVGKLFVTELNHKLDDKNGEHIISCTFYVEIEDDVEIIFSKDKSLKQGCYKITGDMSEYNSNNDEDGSTNIDHKDLDLFTIRKIDKADYMKVKKLSAVTLNFEEPLYGKW